MRSIVWPLLASLILPANSFARLGDRLRKMREASPGLVTYSIAHQNRERQYHVYIPAGKPAAGFPVVFAFHGGGGDGRSMDGIIHLNPVAEKEGFLVVYPEGVDQNWNDGRPERNADIDDVGFFDAVLADLSKHYPIDRSRVYATGMSNGGLMSFRLACERPNAIAAIAPVVANMGANYAPRCSPSLGISIMNIVSDKDPLMPFPGGQITGPLGFRKLGAVLSSDETVKFWLKRLDCTGKPEIKALRRWLRWHYCRRGVLLELQQAESVRSHRNSQRRTHLARRSAIPGRTSHWQNKPEPQCQRCNLAFFQIPSALRGEL